MNCTSEITASSFYLPQSSSYSSTHSLVRIFCMSFSFHLILLLSAQHNCFLEESVSKMAPCLGSDPPPLLELSARTVYRLKLLPLAQTIPLHLTREATLISSISTAYMLVCCVCRYSRAPAFLWHVQWPHLLPSLPHQVHVCHCLCLL